MVTTSENIEVRKVVDNVAILQKTNWDLNEIFNFIAKFEGFRTNAYRDYSQRAIWYGTKSYKWEVIKEKEARKRKIEIIKRDLERYNLKDKPVNVQVAVISFVYNLGGLKWNQKRLLDNGYYCALGNKFLAYTYAWWDQLKGLVKRRKAEKNLLCN